MAVASAAVGGLVANIVLPLLDILVVALRLAARRKKRAPLKVDDWTIVVSLLICLAFSASGIYAACSGLHGVPYDQMPEASFRRFRIVEFSDILLSHFVYGLIKLSVLFFYKRIFFPFDRFIFAANIIIGATILFIIVSFFTVLFCTRDVSSFWNTPAMSDGTQYVIYLPTLLTTYAVLDIALDLAILSLPIPLIWSMCLSCRKRVYVAGVFLLGASCLICSAVRLYYMRATLDYNGKSMRHEIELNDNANLWSHTEAYASVVAACLPTLGPLFSNIHGFDALFDSVCSPFSSRSKFSSSLGEVSPFTKKPDNLQNERMLWHEMNTGGAHAYVIVDKSGNGFEEGSQRNDNIVVHKTFELLSERT
ncbi:hypothetical protein M501DRAFT_211771 [Patellaria atrata CBS 101060]|uniref:Rhodopsin domain-containing protein n=1 Tax=Patellaria atrata CBS 101060 TaxID=1346257 RepID=A0A9P4VQX9_9PEZI|nr:hypothetical protein M501DRAFT_211771 [Patellaria atrata CBS 101060]